MNFLVRLWIPVFVLLLTGDVFTQEKAPYPWTLQQCIEHAFKNNLQIKLSGLNAELSQVNLNQSRAQVLPSLNGSVSHSYNFGRTIDPFTNQFATDQVLSQNFSISTSVTLFSGLQNYNTILQSRYDLQAGRHDHEKTKNDIALAIATAFLQVLFSQEIHEASLNQAEVTRAQVERTKKLVEVGNLAKGSLLDVQAQLATEELAVTNAQNNLNLAYLTLAQYLDIEPTPDFKIVKPEISLPDESLVAVNAGDVFNKAVASQPEIKSAEMKLKSAEKALSVSRGAISPTLSLSGSFGTGYSGARQRLKSTEYLGFSPSGDFTGQGDTVYSPDLKFNYEGTPFKVQIDENLNKTIGLYLRIPLFNQLQTHSAVQRAKIQMLNAEYTLELTKNTLQKTIQQAHADAIAALKKYHATKKSVDALKESFQYTQQKFDVGMVNSVDYNTAKNQLRTSESELLQAKYDFVFKTKVLDFYQGKPLVF